MCCRLQCWLPAPCMHGVRCGGQQYDCASKSARRAAIAAQERVAVRPSARASGMRSDLARGGTRLGRRPVARWRARQQPAQRGGLARAGGRFWFRERGGRGGLGPGRRSVIIDVMPLMRVAREHAREMCVCVSHRRRGRVATVPDGGRWGDGGFVIEFVFGRVCVIGYVRKIRILRRIYACILMSLSDAVSSIKIHHTIQDTRRRADTCTFKHTKRQDTYLEPDF